MTTADPTRSPAGTESAWAYTHVMGRHIAFPSDLEAANANLVDGCINGGTSDRLALAATRALAGPR
jgi:hypothetical protein